MWRIHKIPLNESLCFVSLLFVHPLLPAVEYAPFPRFHFLHFFFFFLPPRFITIHTLAFKWKCHPRTVQSEHVNRLFSVWLN